MSCRSAYRCRSRSPPPEAAATAAGRWISEPFPLPGGLRLPLTLVRERITAWEVAAAERTEQSARQEGEQQLLALLSARLPEGSTVTDTRFAAVRQGDRLTVVLKAECLEQIGQTVTLPETETTQR